MRLELTAEIIRNDKDKYVYVYKIEQSLYAKKSVDIRDLINDLIGTLYVKIRNLNIS